jgi:hypothetical protein
MMNIDYALRIYTDMINNNEPIDLKYFKDNLGEEEYNEFIETIPFINMIKSLKVTDKFKEMFEKVNAYKDELYALPSVANFRTDKSAASKDVSEKVDAIFEEEFGDE